MSTKSITSMAKGKATEAVQEIVAPEPINTIRAKFQVSAVWDEPGGVGKRVSLIAVVGTGADGTNENESFAKSTPSGVINLLVDNPDIDGFFQSGQEFYIDITKAD